MGYFLEPIVMLAPFSKKPLSLTLKGITTDDKDLSVRPPREILDKAFTQSLRGRSDTHGHSPTFRAVWDFPWTGA